MSPNEYSELSAKFAAIGARLRVRDDSNWPGRMTGYRVDVRHDRKREYFELRILDQFPNLEVIDLRPKLRHLLLAVRELKPFGFSTPAIQSKFLFGHDERHWFVAGVPMRSTTVENAMQRLKPPVVVSNEGYLGVRFVDRHRRHNKVFVRQGEWFFLPSPHLEPNPLLINRPEPLVRGMGKPHVAEEGYRRGGATVYVCIRYPNGLTTEEYTKLLAANQQAQHFGWRVMKRGMEVYVRGRVHHPDHATIYLHAWHRVLPNNEVTYSIAGQTPVVFLD